MLSNSSPNSHIQKPIHLVSVNSQGKLFLHPQAISHLRTLKSPISILSIAGPYRTGKSFLLNSLISKDKNHQFKVGHTVNETTHGLWIWGKPILAQNNQGKISNVIVMDSQGYSSSESTHDKRIITLALLLSSCFLYNSKGPVDKDSLFDLEFVIQVARMISSQNSARANCDFHWILRDFHLDLVNELGTKITPNQYMENSLLQAGERVNQRTVQTLKQYFPNRACHCFICPNLEEGKQQRPQFTQQILEFKKILKGIKSLNINGEALVAIMQSYVDAMNNNQDVDNVFQEGYDCRVRLDCMEKLNVKLKKLDFDSSQENIQIDEKLLGIKSQLRQFYKQRMCSNKQISVLDNDVEQVIQEYQAQYISHRNSHRNSFRNSSSIKVRPKACNTLRIPKSSSLSKQPYRVSLHCSQTDYRSDNGSLIQKPNLQFKQNTNSIKADKTMMVKIEELQVKLHRAGLEIENYQAEGKQLRQEIENLKIQIGNKQDQIIKLMNASSVAGDQKSNRMNFLDEKCQAQEKELKLLHSEIDKVQLLSKEKIQFLQKRIQDFDLIKEKQIQEIKLKYKSRISDLSQQINHQKLQHEDEINQIKQIYIQKDEEKRKQLSTMTGYSDEKLLFQELRQKTRQLEEVKYNLQDFKNQNEKLKQSLQVSEKKYESKEKLLTELAQQQQRRYGEIQDHLRIIYEGKMSSKNSHIKQLQAKIQTLTETIKNEDQKIMKKLQQVASEYTEEKQDLFTMNTELRNSCHEALQRINLLKEELDQKDKRLHQLQIQKQKLKTQLKQTQLEHQRQTKDFKEKAGQLNQQIQQKNQQFVRLKASQIQAVHKKQKQIWNASQKINELQNTISGLRTNDAHKNESLDEVINEKFKLQKVNCEQSRLIANLQNEVEQQSQKFFQLRRNHSEEIGIVKDQLQASNKQKCELIANISELNKKLSQNFNNIEQLFKQKYQSQCSRYEDTLKELKAYQRKSSQLSDQSAIEVVRLQEQVKYLKQENQKILKQKQSLARQLKQTSVLLTKNQRKNNENQRENTKKYALLQHKLSFAEKMVQQIKQSKEKQQDENEQKEKGIKKRMQKLQNQNSEQKKRLCQIQRQLESQRLQRQTQSIQNVSQMSKYKKIISIYQKDQIISSQNLLELESQKQEMAVRYQNHINLFSSKFSRLKIQKQNWEVKYQQARLLIDELTKLNSIANGNHQQDYNLWSGKLERMESILINQSITDNGK